MLQALERHQKFSVLTKAVSIYIYDGIIPFVIKH